VRGYELACELAAAAVQRELEALARSARVPLASGPRATVVPSALPGLTTREHEILGYLVAGSTYAEIANTLVISEKTVSAHLSNLLRKHTPPAGLSWRSWLTALTDRAVGLSERASATADVRQTHRAFPRARSRLTRDLG
jgi:DNA-binding CsgD family transcriptional regulator